MAKEKTASDFRYNTGDTKVPWAAVGENYNAADALAFVKFLMQGKGAAYNAALLDILPKAHIAVNLVPRAETGGEVISASTARNLLRDGDWKRLADFLPETTLAYLRDPEHAGVLEKIRNAAPAARHG